MHALIRFDTTDADAFLDTYASASERRDQAGLTQLQLWREKGTSAVWGLYDVADREKVAEWLSSETGLRDALSGTEAHYLRTV
ncbi:hypothetical protein [Palleronia pelagia]|uniref:Mono-oxygenase ydhR n=1 Tax=Palleronia pelagia TaxID=387096 RepID=A0A1H8GH82_9RHOB|nr:hypothetical protein [Palleronia pelagia]SEN43114.1 hypothetical protein SAMN04488011_10471 [Palleronia pelagia]